jgi:hypothetical protein
MKTPEGYQKADVKKYLDTIRAYHFWPVPGGYGQQGVDCYACIDGSFWAIEVKKEGVSEPTKRQSLTMKEVETAKGQTVCGDAKTVIDLISYVVKNAD